MSRSDRNAAIAAAIILAAMIALFYFLPAIMVALGDVPAVAAAVVALVVVGPFVLFWLRGRHRRRGED